MPGAPGKKIPAQFLTMAGAVSPFTRTIVTELVVDNAQEGLLPGAYVNVNFTFPSDPEIVIIPSQALLFRAQGCRWRSWTVRTMCTSRMFHWDTTFGLDVQIVAGLKATDRLVANPSLGLLEGQEVKVVRQRATSRASSRAPERCPCSRTAPI